MEPAELDSISERVDDIIVRLDANQRVVSVIGDLDLATFRQTAAALLQGDEPDIRLDLSGTNFMDCAGYRAIALARHRLGATGRHLAVNGAKGEPSRLLALIDDLQRCWAPTYGDVSR